MPTAKLCVEPRIGERVSEYNEDALRQPESKNLTYEESMLVEIHFLRCTFCRMKLNSEARSDFETKLVLIGFFLEDPVLLKRRKEAVKRFFQDELSFEEFKGSWLAMTAEERQKIKKFFEEDC